MPKHYYKASNYQAKVSVGYLLRRAGKLVTSRIEELFVEEEVTFVQWVILMNLRDRLATTSAELSQHLCHDSGALTRVLDGMEARGLIKRQRSTEDRRVVELALTPEGLKVTEFYIPRLVDLYNAIFEDFTREEADQTISLLMRLNDKLATKSVTKEN